MRQIPLIRYPLAGTAPDNTSSAVNIMEETKHE